MADDKGPLLVSIVPAPAKKTSGGFSLLAWLRFFAWFILVCAVLNVLAWLGWRLP